ncbi:uncharacterized protein LOC122650589 [Telopea speciosissima]|uniref:uncharacterized protein LOC122650589 n=1 Tax=Telopea speciosissima TaxID=54955 RepID=UPI001CC51EC7|nr:uncharacterized protein LOC122650589 [Telopea speciosissima]
MNTIDEYLKEYRASWKQTGCSIIADGWTDMINKSLINFLVYCPCGVYFLSSVDASGICKDKVNLANLFDKVVQNVSVQNVVQIVTDNQSSYKAAGKNLANEKYKSFYWAPCTVHCIDLMLEDIVKLKKMTSYIAKGRKITKFIYNHSWVLSMIRSKFTEGKDLMPSTSTRLATHYIVLGCLMNHRRNLRRMFDSDDWLNSRYAKLVVRKEVKKIVRSRSFWRNVYFIYKCFAPLVRVLKLVSICIC